MEPRPGLAARPGHADVGAGRVAQPEMDPAELAAGVTAPDRDLAAKDAVADARLHPRTDRIDIRRGLQDAEREPVTHRTRMRYVPGTDVPPQPDRITEVDHDQ